MITEAQVAKLAEMAKTLQKNHSYALVEAVAIGNQINEILQENDSPYLRNLARAHKVAKENVAKWTATLVSIEREIKELEKGLE